MNRVHHFALTRSLFPRFSINHQVSTDHVTGQQKTKHKMGGSYPGNRRTPQPQQAMPSEQGPMQHFVSYGGGNALDFERWLRRLFFHGTLTYFEDEQKVPWVYENCVFRRKGTLPLTSARWPKWRLVA